MVRDMSKPGWGGYMRAVGDVVDAAVGVRDLTWKPRVVFSCLVAGFVLHILAWYL